MTDEMMVAIIVDSLIDADYCDLNNFDEVGKLILQKIKRYRKVSAQSLGDFRFEPEPALSAQSDLFYSSQQVMNERTKPNSGDKLNIQYHLNHTPVLPGTLTGTIYIKTQKDSEGKNGVAVQTFVADAKGDLAFTDIDRPELKVLRGNLIHSSGELLLEWNEKPGVNVCVFNYEYNANAE